MPAYEADLERFAGYDAQVLGISVDSVPCNTAWARSLGNLSYDLLSDFHPKGEVAKAYGAYRENDGISERALFIVDKEGKLAVVDIHNIADQPDNEDLFEVLRKLKEPVVRDLMSDVGHRVRHLEFFLRHEKCNYHSPLASAR